MFAIETNNMSENRSTIATSSIPSETKNTSEKRLRNPCHSASLDIDYKLH